MIEVIRQVPSDDPNKAGQLTFEDPDLADARMKRQNRAESEREIFFDFLIFFTAYSMGDSARRA